MISAGGAAAGPGCRITAVYGLAACPWQHIAATADTGLLRACRCREPGPGPAPAARLVAGQRRAGECGDERGRGCGASEQGSLAVGSGPPLVEPVQQPGDRLGVAVVPERGIDMIQETGAERRRTTGCPVNGSAPAPASPWRAAAASAAATCRAGAAPPASRGGPRPGRWRPGRGSAPPAAPRCRRRGRRRRPGPRRWGSAGTAGQEVDAPLVQRRPCPIRPRTAAS